MAVALSKIQYGFQVRLTLTAVREFHFMWHTIERENRLKILDKISHAPQKNVFHGPVDWSKRHQWTIFCCQWQCSGALSVKLFSHLCDWNKHTLWVDTKLYKKKNSMNSNIQYVSRLHYKKYYRAETVPREKGPGLLLRYCTVESNLHCKRAGGNHSCPSAPANTHIKQTLTTVHILSRRRLTQNKPIIPR